MHGLPLNLSDLVNAATVEDYRREFKAAWNDATKGAVVATVCAFANDLLNLNGGYVVLGIEQDPHTGRPVLPPRGLGGQNLDRLQVKIRGGCEAIEPRYQPMTFVEEFQGQPIIVLWAPGGDTRPYQAPRVRKEGKAYFVRQGVETVEAKGDVLRQLIELTARVPFDDRRSLEGRIEDLSPTLARKFLAEVGSSLLDSEPNIPADDLWRRLRVATRVDDHDVPRNGGLLFFADDPQRFFRGAQIDVVRFPEGPAGDTIEESTIRGPLPDQVRMALQYLSRFCVAAYRKVPGKPAASRALMYPYEALREAVVNAVYHRSYEIAEPTKVYIHPDRVVVTSFPGPVPGIELRHLEPGAIVPDVPARNRRVGEFLKELRLAEMRGTGLPRIWRSMRENGSPEPVIGFDPDRTYFSVTLPVHPERQWLY